MATADGVPSGFNHGLKSTALQLFERLAGSYDRAVDYATFFQDRYWKKWVAKQMPGRDADLVLDLGCGTLLMEERLAHWSCRFVGLDLTERMVRIGRSKELGNVSLLVNGDAEYLPFPDKAFDSVISCYVAKYVNVFKFSSELARVTKPGGAAVLYDFARPRGALAPFIDLYIQWGLRTAGVLLELARKEAAFTFTTLPGIIEETEWDLEIVRAMEGAGFETSDVRRMTAGVVFAYSGRKKKNR